MNWVLLDTLMCLSIERRRRASVPQFLSIVAKAKTGAQQRRRASTAAAPFGLG